MTQLFVPYVLATTAHPLDSQATFCTGQNQRPIAFTSVDKVQHFVAEAKKRLGLLLEWGTASELEFPGLLETDLDVDPMLPTVLVVESTPPTQELARI